MARKNKKNSSLFAASCVVLGILIILLMFLVKREQIVTNLKETAFFDKVFGTTPEFIQKHESVERADAEEVVLKTPEAVAVQDEERAPEKDVIRLVEQPARTEEKPKAQEEQRPAEPKAEQKNPETPAQKPAEKPVVTKPASMDLQLCFIFIDGDGAIVRRMVKRSVQKNDSPLVTAVNLLLAGPDTTRAAEKNCMTLIPPGTKLLGARVQNGVAYLNFNENFMFNSAGAEGYQAQLMQIVYTATSFSTVSSVQFLIDGEKQQFLSDGVPQIGIPLSPASF